ncbi:hypothetical protein FRC10_011004, partial [Ceratobasidium sp. 414]
MYGTTKAILIAAVALQASANPVSQLRFLFFAPKLTLEQLFNRQASSSSVPVSTASSNLTTSVFLPTATVSSGHPTPTDPTFPFPGSSNGTNGTYYICSFPPTNETAPTSSAPLSTGTAPLTTTLPSVAATASSSVPTNVFAVNATTSSGSTAPVTTSVVTASISVPTPTPTPFTVVGPSATITI